MHPWLVGADFYPDGAVWPIFGRIRSVEQVAFESYLLQSSLVTCSETCRPEKPGLYLLMVPNYCHFASDFA